MLGKRLGSFSKQRFPPIRKKGLPQDSQKGAQLIEFALVFPIILALMLALIWLATALNSITAFKNAVHDAPRFAVTRGRMENFQSSASCAACNTDILALPSAPNCPNSPLLVHQVTDWSHYDTSVPCGFSLCDTSMPMPYLHTIIFVNQSMLSNIGNQVKFPCDPTGTTEDADGCLRCNIDPPLLGPALDCSNLPYEHFTLTCQFRPNNLLTGPISRLLGKWTGRPMMGVIEERMGI